METFDVAGARKAGYSDEDIARHLGKEHGFDADGALKSGYKPDELIKEMGTRGERSGFDKFLGSVGDFAKAAGEGLNPITIAKGAADTLRAAYTHPIDTATGLLQRNAQSLDEAKTAWKRGDYTSAAAHAINYLIPFGSSIDEMTNDIDAGHVATALGKATAFGVQMAAPGNPTVRRLVSKIPDLKIPGFRNANAAETAAVDFGKANDIPVNAGMATGNKFVQGVQKAADHTPLGSVVAGAAEKGQAEAFGRVGNQLADQIHPTSVSPPEAGRAVTTDIEGTIAQHHAEADRQYSILREIEADPANVRTVQVGTKQVPWIDEKTGMEIPGKTRGVPDMQDVALPVDLAQVKKMLRPIYQQFQRQLPVTQMRASTGLKAIENIINGPDAESASIVDRDLSAIKAAARGGDEVPQLATLSQGLAKQAVQHLHDAVSDAVGKAERTAKPGAVPSAAPAAGSQQQPAGAPAAMAAAGAQKPGMIYGADEYGDVVSQPAIGPRSAETTVTVPGEPDNVYKGRYEVRELADVQSSHNGQTFAPNAKYSVKNDRNYNNPVNQRKVVDWSTEKEFDPSYHITDNPDATNGPPVIDSEGNVLGGNGRTMILDRVYQGNPKGAAAYRAHLEQKAAQFGIDPKELASKKQPVLVRVIDDAELPTPESKQAAVTDFNKSGTAALTPAEQAITDSRRVSPATMEHVAGKLDAAGTDATLAHVLEGDSGREILHKLMEDRVIAPQEGAKFLTETGLTKAGKDRVSQLMLGRFFRDPEQFDSLPASARNKIERIAAPLVKTEAEGPYNLTPHVQGAVDLMETARAHGSTVDDYLQQSGLFAKQRYSPEAIEIAKHLKDSNPNALTDMVRHYAEAAKYAGDYQGPGMFGDLEPPLSPREAFNESFDTSLPKTADAAPPPEPAAAPKPSAAFAQAFAPPAPPAAPPARVPGVPAGREAMNALGAGRAATAAKYDAAGVLKSLPRSGEEGKAVFDSAVWRRDGGIEHLRELKRIAPAQIPKIARAYLEQLLDKATTEGGFSKAKGLQTEWLNMGKETKELLYPNPLMREHLDNFFRLARMAAENPNPSQSGVFKASIGFGTWVLANPATGIPATIGTGVLAQLLHSPKGVAALTAGLKVSLANKAAASLAASRILSLVQEAQPKAPAAPAYPKAAEVASPSQQTDQPVLTASR